MYPENLVDVLKQVLTSWQVIAITLIIFTFFKLVSHVAKSYHKPRTIKIKKPMFKKKEPEPEIIQEGSGDEDGADSNDELGLEEE